MINVNIKISLIDWLLHFENILVNNLSEIQRKSVRACVYRGDEANMCSTTSSLNS